MLMLPLNKVVDMFMSDRSCQYLLFFTILLFSSYFVGVREVDTVSDTQTYIDIYNSIEIYFWERLEFGFIAFAGVINYFGLSYQVFLASCFLFISCFMFLSFNKLNNEVSDRCNLLSLFLFLGFLFSSSWFYAATLNGLRQGMGLSILYFAASFLIDDNNKNKFYFLFFFVLGGFFHKSVYLLLPFVIPLLFNGIKLRYYTVFFCLFSLGYFWGLNESVVRVFSNVIGSGLYHKIAGYCESCWMEPSWYGFNFKFYIYTVFWYFLTVAALALNFFISTKIHQVTFVAKIYSVCSIFYFLFGFAGFANRWAFTAWLFIPILQATIICSLKISFKIKLLIALGMFLFYVYYMARLVV